MVKHQNLKGHTIGTVESVESANFNIFDKVLLGHLHHPFSITDNIVDYSGSLLQYSFSEVSGKDTKND